MRIVKISETENLCRNDRERIHYSYCSSEQLAERLASVRFEGLAE